MYTFSNPVQDSSVEPWVWRVCLRGALVGRFGERGIVPSGDWELGVSDLLPSFASLEARVRVRVGGEEIPRLVYLAILCYW